MVLVIHRYRLTLRLGELLQNEIGSQPWNRDSAEIGIMAAPAVFGGKRRHFCTNGIVVNIAGKLQKIVVGIDQQRFISSLEKMPRLFSSTIDVSGIPEGEVLDNSGKRNVTNLNDQMDMIGHQAVDMYAMLESLTSLLEQEKKSATVMVLEKNRGSSITPKDNMIKGTWIMNSGFASHAS